MIGIYKSFLLRINQKLKHILTAVGRTTPIVDHALLANSLLEDFTEAEVDEDRLLEGGTEHDILRFYVEVRNMITV
jgi:hypothetical protein